MLPSYRTLVVTPERQTGCVGDPRSAVSVTLLERELYAVDDAARLLRVHPRTLRNWLDGYEGRGGARYKPVVRSEPTGRDTMTWGEFVEAGLLAEYRRRRAVPLQHIRPVVEALRERYGIPYPLAHFRPYVADKELVVRLQAESDVPSSVLLVVERRGQLVLNGPAEVFFEKAEFEDEVVRRFFPAGRSSPVVIDPAHNFGLPEVRGIRTEALVELFEAGESIDMIARGYDLARDEVEEAIRFETGRPRDAEPMAVAQ